MNVYDRDLDAGLELDDGLELWRDLDDARAFEADDAIASAHDWPEHYGDDDPLRAARGIANGIAVVGAPVALAALIAATIDPLVWKWVGGTLAIVVLALVSWLYIDELLNGDRDRADAPYDWRQS